MTDIKLEILITLDRVLKENLQASKAYECLKIMCEDSIQAKKAGNDENISFSRWKLKARYDGGNTVNDTDTKELQKWIDDKQLNKCLSNLISTHLQEFQSLGYTPVVKRNETKGGKGNEREYWLDIQPILEAEVTNDEAIVDTSSLVYQRAKPETIKISFIYRTLFKNGELKNRSVHGALLITIIFLVFIFWVAYLVGVSMILSRTESSFGSFSLIGLIAIGLFTWSLWKYWLMPIWLLPEHRVIKAPSTFLAFNELDAEIEIYRDQDKRQVTRFTRFTSTCPICTADVILRSGQPDQKAPLVGRCVESPFSHVYSFDRVTLKGKRLIC